MRVVVLVGLVAGLLTGCGGDGPVDVPQGVTFRVEQVRQDLQNRHFQLQVVNGGRTPVTVAEADFDSGRLDRPAHYDGPATVRPGTSVNLTMSMPRARCGDGLDATVRVRYSVDGADTVTSEVRPSDHYGSVERFMRRDCAERTLGDLAIDRRLAVAGRGDDARLTIGFTVTPPSTGRRIRLLDVGGSTLLAPAGPDATRIDRELEPGDEPLHVEVTFIPNRCDVHAVAEDRTGGIVPLAVESSAFGRSVVYLRFDEPQKTQIFDYLADRCGFGRVKDPLNAS